MGTCARKKGKVRSKILDDRKLVEVGLAIVIAGKTENVDDRKKLGH